CLGDLPGWRDAEEAGARQQPGCFAGWAAGRICRRRTDLVGSTDGRWEGRTVVTREGNGERFEMVARRQVSGVRERSRRSQLHWRVRDRLKDSEISRSERRFGSVSNLVAGW